MVPLSLLTRQVTSQKARLYKRLYVAAFALNGIEETKGTSTTYFIEGDFECNEEILDMLDALGNHLRVYIDRSAEVTDYFIKMPIFYESSTIEGERITLNWRSFLDPTDIEELFPVHGVNAF